MPFHESGFTNRYTLDHTDCALIAHSQLVLQGSQEGAHEVFSLPEVGWPAGHGAPGVHDTDRALPGVFP